MKKVITLDEFLAFKEKRKTIKKQEPDVRRAIKRQEYAIRSYAKKTAFKYVLETHGVDLNEAAAGWKGVEVIDKTIFAKTGPIIIDITQWDWCGATGGRVDHLNQYKIPRKVIFPKG